MGNPHETNYSRLIQMNFWVYDTTRRSRNLKFLTTSLITTAKWGCDIDLFKLISCADLNIK